MELKLESSDVDGADEALLAARLHVYHLSHTPHRVDVVQAHLQEGNITLCLHIRWDPNFFYDCSISGLPPSRQTLCGPRGSRTRAHKSKGIPHVPPGKLAFHFYHGREDDQLRILHCAPMSFAIHIHSLITWHSMPARAHWQVRGWQGPTQEHPHFSRLSRKTSWGQQNVKLT